MFVLALAASQAHAGVTYTGCLKTSDPSLCIMDKAFAGTGALPWTDRMDDLVESGDVERTVKLAGQVRPLSGLLADLHSIPSDNDIAAIDDVDPEAAQILRANDTDLAWQRYAAAHGAELSTRGIPPAAVAGFALAAAAYRSPDPFADPAVQAPLSAVKTPADQERMLLRAMRSIRPAGRAYAVAPVGARAVLDHAKALAQPSAEFDAVFAEFAWWAGDNAAAAAALDHLKADPAAAARHWGAVARILAALGRPAEAQALVAAHGEGRDKLKAELAIGDAWLAAGDKVRASASAHAALGEAGDDAEAQVQATALLDRAGDHTGATSTARALAAAAEGGDPAGRSAGLASASEAFVAIGENAEACRDAHRALQVAGDSAAAQVAAWKRRYQGSQVPLSPWYGVDFSGDPIPVDDVRDAFRERAAAALEACGAADEAAKARGAHGSSGAWRAVAPVEDASLTPAQRLKTEAALVSPDPKLAARLADAAALAPEPDDPVAKLMWRDAEAYALAAAGRADAARAMAASAVRGLDEMSNPQDQQAVALTLAKDHRAVDTLTASGGAFGRTLPQ